GRPPARSWSSARGQLFLGRHRSPTRRAVPAGVRARSLMKVAVYHPWVYLKGGAERTLLELMRRSRHEWVLLTNHFEPESTFPDFSEVPVIELARVSVRRNVWTVGHAGLRLLTQSLPLADASALLISSEGLGNLVPLRPRGVPVFSFCHTPLKIAYDPFTRGR